MHLCGFFFLRLVGVRKGGPPTFFLFRLCRFLHSVQIMQQITLTGKHVKWSVTLADRLGPEIVTVFKIKGQVLHRVRLHVKVPGLVVRLKCTPK